MKHDDIFRKACRLQPPESLRGKVMGQINRGETAGDRHSSLLSRLSAHFFTKHVGWSVVAATVALVITIRLVQAPQPEIVKPPDVSTDTDIAEFVDEMLAPVFGVTTVPSGESLDESDNLDTYIANQLSEIFWINGGYDA